jgi:hypothetical protein
MMIITMVANIFHCCFSTLYAGCFSGEALQDFREMLAHASSTYKEGQASDTPTKHFAALRCIYFALVVS